MKSIARRTFLKKSSFAGIAALSALTFPDDIFGMVGQLKNTPKGPVCSIKKEVYVSFSKPRMAPITDIYYVGNGIRREETRSFMQLSDWHESVISRISEDNGRSWSEWESIPARQVQTNPSGIFTLLYGPNQRGTGPYDPVSNRLIKISLQRIIKGEKLSGSKFWDHVFYQLSEDNGITWGKAYQLKYEEGPDFDPSDWGNQEYLNTNQMYPGNNLIVLRNGTIVASSKVLVPYRDEEDDKYPTGYANKYYIRGYVGGAMSFVGKWNNEAQNYIWKKSNSIFLPRLVSSRGLMENELCELTNGNLLIIMRGSNVQLDITKAPGRKWYSVSTDGGLTWGEIKDMRFDTGEQFYSPSSIHRTIRSSKTGKLYWIGNICDEIPNGNYPRYPLQIIEIDEEEPSFRKDTLTVIDERDPERDSESLQLSNLSLLENRETKNLELYLTRLGENGGKPAIWTANSYKYTLVF